MGDHDPSVLRHTYIRGTITGKTSSLTLYKSRAYTLTLQLSPCHLASASFRSEYLCSCSDPGR